MKQRKGKFTLGMKIASILSCIALVSVGFASWWIVQLPDPVTYENGSFTVYTVDTKNVIIENFKVKDNTEANVIFGKTSGVTERWLLADEEVKAENLKVTFTFDVTLYDNYDPEATTNTPDTDGSLKNFVGNIKLDFAPTVETYLDSAIKEAKYITAPVITYSYGSKTDKITYNPDAATNTLDIDMSGATSYTQQVTLTVEFKWGEAFGSKNPYEYFNDTSRNANGDSGVENYTWAEYAYKALDDIHTLGENTKYNMTLTAEVPAN